MTSKFPTRALLLAFFPIAGLLIFALWTAQGGDDSVAEAATPTRNQSATSRLARELPGAGASSAASGALALVPDGGEAPASLDEAQDTRHYGSVTGRLVDGLGRPVAGEPVFLVSVSDPWDRGEPRYEDPTPLARLAAHSVSDADGRFDLPAEAGVDHDLFGGGRNWARASMDDVASGDDVDLVLRDGYVLEGVVRDESTGQPVPEAWVLALADATTLLGRSGPDGRYRLGPVPDLVLLVGAYAEGTGIALQNEVLPALGELSLDLPAGAPVEGRLLDGETGEAVPGGEVCLTIDVVAQLLGGREELPDRQHVESQVASAGADGDFALPGGPVRGFVIDATAPGYVPVHYDRYKDRNRDLDDRIEIKMERAEPLAGQAFVADGGAPAVGALLEAHAPQGVFARAEADAEGAFALDTADWDGHGPVWVHARDAEGRTARRLAGKRGQDLVLELVPPLGLAIEVVLDGQPVVGALVAVRSDEALTTTARTDAAGGALVVHELAGPDSGAVTVEARWGSIQSVPVAVDPAEPPDGPLRIELDAGDWMEGWVSDPFGVPVAFAELSLRADPRSGSPLRLDGHADREGHFKLGPLTPDVTWRLSLTSEGYRYKSVGKQPAGSDPIYVTMDPVVRWSGRVVDASTGQPARSFGGQLMQEVVDDQGRTSMRNTRERLSHTPGVPGEFSVPLPGAGRFMIRIVARDHITAESLLVDTNGITPPAFAELMLWPAALLDVTVQDGRGRPVQGYEVTVAPWELAGEGDGPSGKARKAGSQARTDGNGVAHFNLGRGGGYRIAGGPGAWLDAARVEAMPGLTVQRLYRLPATGDLELTIVDENGQPLGGVTVELLSSRDDKAHSIYRRTGMRDDAGRVSFETVPPGKYSVRLRRRSYQSGNHEVYVRGNAIERVRLAMEPRQQAPSASSSVIDSRHRGR